MIRNILGISILFIIVVYVYYKIKYPFWSIQPVFHFHNIKYWFFPPGIIQHDKPKINKFFDSNIDFCKMNDLSTEKKALFSSLIKAHYMPNKHENYRPTNDNIMDYFISHNKPSFISLYFKGYKQERTLVSSMTTRPLKCIIDNENLNLYYVDFLCVHKKHRKQGIAPKNIYTHYYQHRYSYDNPVFLFKREGNTTAIVPLTAYKNYEFDIHHLPKQREFTTPLLKSILLSGASMRHYFDLDKIIKTSFKCYISPNYSHLKHLIDKNLIHIGLVMQTNKVMACYIFRNSHTYYDSKPSVECIGSFNNGLSVGEFNQGFVDSLIMLVERFKYKIVFVENISHNNNIAKYMIKNFKLLSECGASYYFYNFGYRPLPSKDVFLLN